MPSQMKENTHDLDFQIRFYEQILQKHPDFVDVLIALGDAYTKRGLYRKGLEIDKKLVRLKRRDPILYYNLACSHSLLGNIKNALKSLEKAIHLGYKDFGYINKDPDLENLRKDERYFQLLNSLKNKSCKKLNR